MGRGSGGSGDRDIGGRKTDFLIFRCPDFPMSPVLRPTETGATFFPPGFRAGLCILFGMEKKKPEPGQGPQGKFAEVIRKSKERRIELMDKAARKEREAAASLQIPDDMDDE